MSLLPNYILVAPEFSQNFLAVNFLLITISPARPRGFFFVFAKRLLPSLQQRQNAAAVLIGLCQHGL